MILQLLLNEIPTSGLESNSTIRSHKRSDPETDGRKDDQASRISLRAWSAKSFIFLNTESASLILIENMDKAAKVYSQKEIKAVLSDPNKREELSAAHGVTCIVISLDKEVVFIPRELLPSCPVLGLKKANHVNNAEYTDCSAEESILTEVISCIDSKPIAASVLAGLLRKTMDQTIVDALDSESTAYGLLQKSGEYQSSLPMLGADNLTSDLQPTVLTRRLGHQLDIFLNRPELHNAYNTNMRDQLCSVLETVQLDPTIKKVVIQGSGQSFCSGGDLNEFGVTDNPAFIHIVRTTRNSARLLSAISDRAEARVHGFCIGAGLELAAFCHKIIAHEASVFELPEIRYGLVPGAGGTVSLPRRIGRQRTFLMAILGHRVSAEEAKEIGLIDQILPN